MKFSSVHFIGIGGAGMAPLAAILLERGVAVSGSDRELNAKTARLATAGAKIFAGHAATHLPDSAELFLLPEETLNSYWEVIVSPPSNRYTAWHTLGKYGLRSSFPTAPRNLKTASRRTPRGYCVEIAFPFSALPSLSESLPYPGAVLHLMACRTDLQDGGNLIFSAPVPLLYGGHNIYGYIKAVLQKK